MNHTIAIYNFKGGVGKTTSVFNLACAWSKSYRVLVVDFDPQCNLTNALIAGTQDTTNLYTYIKGFLHSYIPDISPAVVKHQLHLIPGHQNMIELESNNQFIEFGLTILQRFLQRVKFEYDIVLIDCPSYFGKTVKYVIGNADSLLIPATPDIFSLKGAIKLLKHVEKMDKTKPLNILGIFLNRYRSRLLFHRKVKNVATRIFGKILIEKTIRNTVRITEATDRNFASSSGKPESSIAADYVALGTFLVDKIKATVQSKQKRNNTTTFRKGIVPGVTPV
ncbi:MAG: ParA family protein [Cyclobacteriaceae bacterium]|nr:ParA family protein [Cyclobacteriaceae bacterium HetDA_MAG_MS6]